MPIEDFFFGGHIFLRFFYKTAFSCPLRSEGILHRRTKMTTTQKETIKQLREQHIGYTEISKAVGLPVNTIKSYCYRQGLHTEALLTNADVCKCCGKVIKVKSKTRPRIFCSDKCKNDWWYRNREVRKNENIVEYTCGSCGKRFTDYVHAERKFCSLACYRSRGEIDGI